jgi:shikimate dehydrogenase
MIVTGNTAVYGVIGDPIAHTLSPPMQNRAMEAMGLDAVYLPFRVAPDELERAIDGMRALSIRGLNVTVPHKSAVIPFLDRLTESAEAVGAVNTILLEGPLLIGENTDGYGFLKCVEGGGVAVFPERVCILGAGGAARSVVYACATRPEVREIAVVNRTLSRARDLADRLSRMTGAQITAHPSDPEEMRRILPDAGMIVNTTTVGMSPNIDRSPVPDPGVFHSGQVVCDIIYTPLRTRLLREAEQRGARTIGGLPMLAWQGARSLSLWTGREAPAGVMLEELMKRVVDATRRVM